MDKEKIAKLEKKLQQRKLTVYEALQQDIVLEWLKTSNPAFMSMLSADTTIEIINLLIIPGPPQDKIRSFKIPMVAAQLLSIMIPKVYELFFLEDPQDKTQIVLSRLLKYFDTEPNYVISGYVVRILMNLMPANPSRVIQYIYKSQPERMLKFLESQSIAEYLLRIIIVEDALLNQQIKERVNLLGEIVSLYVTNKSDEDILANANWMLSEAVTRLWSQKHKELGRFSAMLFKLVEAVIDNSNLYQQQSLIVSICKQVSIYQKQAPFLIAALYKKIYQELSMGRNDLTSTTQQLGRNQPKLSVKRYKYLQALYYIIAQGSQAIAKQLPGSNIFSTLLDYITRYQWHSLALVQIEKIFKAAISSNSEALFTALSRSYFPEKLQELGRQQNTINKFGYGYSGLLLNVAKMLREVVQLGTGYGAWLKKNQREGDLRAWLGGYLGKEKNIDEKVRVVHQVAKPFYHISRLPQQFSQFFQETEEINKRMQSQSPSKHQVEEKEVLEEIENENELVYKLLSQLVSETVNDEKKSENESNE